MPLNGSGSYSAPASSWNPAVDNTDIDASDWAALLADLSTALSTALYKDGQQVPTANIPLGGFKLTGLGAATTSGDALRYEQLFTSGLVTLLGTLKAPTTVGVGAATPAASGSGVTFPATQSPSTDANTLDDYEEGTWTPTLVGSGGGPLTYTHNVGTYVKIGKLVHFSASIIISGGVGITGNVSIQTLPFTSQTLTNYNVAIAVAACNFTLDASYTFVTAFVTSNSAIVTIYENGSAQASATPPAASIGAGSTIVVSGCYIAAT